jgi:hypothetical protein
MKSPNSDLHPHFLGLIIVYTLGFAHLIERAPPAKSSQPAAKWNPDKEYGSADGV